MNADHRWRDTPSGAACSRCGCRGTWPLADQPCPRSKAEAAREQRRGAAEAARRVRPSRARQPAPIDSRAPWAEVEPAERVALTERQIDDLHALIVRSAELGRQLTTGEVRRLWGLRRTGHVADRLRASTWQALARVVDGRVQLLPVLSIETVQQATEQRRAQAGPRKRKPLTAQQRAKSRAKVAQRRAQMTEEARRAEWARHQRARRERLRAERAAA